jgi:large subunit ribosomal protein L17
MRHQKASLKLNRTTSHRRAMFRNMVTSLFKYNRIRTTAAKAKELRRWADHLITLAKRGDLHARRQALSIVREKSVVHKLFEVATERYGSVSGGYTRIVKLGRRMGDAAPISMIELVVVEKDKKKKKVTKKKVKTTAEAKKAPREEVEPEKKEDKSQAVKEKAVKKKAEKNTTRKKAEPESEAKVRRDKKTDEADVAEKKAEKKEAEKVEKKVTRRKAKSESESEEKPVMKGKATADKPETAKKKPVRRTTQKSEEKD